MTTNVYETMPAIKQCPETLIDYTGMRGGTVIVAGYHRLMPDRITPKGNKVPTQRRHMWSCYCTGCDMYFTINRQELRRRLVDKSKVFTCPACHYADQKRGDV